MTADLSGMVGRTLNGIYRIADLVGSGGFADVYLGRDLRTNAVVALKVLHPQFARDPVVVRRFTQEARTALSLTEPHVVSVLGSGEHAGVFYIAMEYVQGLTLAELLKRRGPLPIAESVGYVRQMLLALRAAHAAGIVHRDIKPANVMVTGDGFVKVMDFGIAKHATVGRLTLTGQYIGTPEYMAPEQATDAAADARTDVYAVAVTLYELIAGRTPFQSENPWAVLNKQMSLRPQALTELRPDVPAELDRVVAQGLEKDPRARLQSAVAMLDALARLPLEQPGGGPSRRATASGFRALAVPRVAVPVVVAVLATVSLAVFLTSSPSTPSSGELASPMLELLTPTPVRPTVVVAAGPISTPAPAIALPAVATTAPTPVPTATPGVTERWQSTLIQLDATWGNDWPRTIEIVDGFLSRAPNYAPAREKLYAALVLFGQERLASSEQPEAVALYERALQLEPDRAEALDALHSLTPTPVPQPIRPAVLVPAPRAPAPQPTRPPVVQPQPALPTKPPFVPPG